MVVFILVIPIMVQGGMILTGPDTITDIITVTGMVTGTAITEGAIIPIPAIRVTARAAQETEPITDIVVAAEAATEVSETVRPSATLVPEFLQRITPDR